MREGEPVITDQITVSLLSALPDLYASVREALRAGPQFMDVLGQMEFKSGSLQRIEIHYWTPNKIIHDLRFRNGDRLADLALKFANPLPLSMLTKLLASDVGETLGHPVFEGYRWRHEAEQSGDTLHVDIKSDLDLGLSPLAELERLVSIRSRELNPPQRNVA